MERQSHLNNSIQSIQSRDPDKTVSFYADDVTALYDGFAPIHDRGALLAVYKEFLADKNFSFQVTPVRVDASGNLGYSQGSLSYTSTDPASGKPVSFNGSYVLVWKRQSDNSWKAVEDISTPGAPPASK